jgi:hypothetical protein
MLDLKFKLNPRVGEIPTCSAVLNGVAAHYRVESYRTTLSVKAVQRGAALYVTPRARHLVCEDSFLILNCGQEYYLDFQWPAPTETLCPFFQPGFVEHVAASRNATTRRQLDDIDGPSRSMEFCERLYPRQGRVGDMLAQLHGGIAAGWASSDWLEDRFYELAGALVDLAGRAFLPLAPRPRLLERQLRIARLRGQRRTRGVPVAGAFSSTVQGAVSSDADAIPAGSAPGGGAPAVD